MTTLDFKKNNGLIPAIIQDHKTNLVYMLGYINQQSLKMTQKTGYVHFFSRSRNELWMKGEESGNKLKVKKILYDCDGDSLLIKVELEGTHVCHTGAESCFTNELITNL